MRIDEKDLKAHACDDMRKKAPGVIQYSVRDDLYYHIIASCLAVSGEVSKAAQFFMTAKVENFATVAAARDHMSSVCYALGRALCDFDLLLAASELCPDDQHLNSVMIAYSGEWNRLVRDAVRNGMPKDYQVPENHVTLLRRPAFAESEGKA